MNVQDPPRQPIWSVPSEWLAAYVILFDTVCTIGVAYVIWYHIAVRSGDSVHDTILGIFTGIVTVGIASALLCYLTVDLGKNTMVLGTYLENWLKRREARRLAEAIAEGLARGHAEGHTEGRAEGRVEGRVKGHAEGRAEVIAELSVLIREWNERRLAAERKGEKFDEPPPSLDE